MFKSARMKKATIAVLDRDIEPLLHALANFGKFELSTSEELRKELDLQHDSSQITEKCNELRARATYVVDVLGIAEPEAPVLQFKEVERKRIVIDKDRISETFKQVESDLSKMEYARDVASQIETLRAQSNTLKTRKAASELSKKAAIPPMDLREGRFLTVVFGEINNGDIAGLKKELASVPAAISTKPLNKDYSAIAIAYPKEHAQEIEKALSLAEFNRVQPEESSIEEITKEMNSVQQAMKAGEERLSAAKRDFSLRLLAIRELLDNEQTIISAVSNTARSHFFYAMTGWVPAERLDEMKAVIGRKAGGSIIIIGDPAHEEEEEVPILLKNKRPFRSFEPIVSMFGLPTYKEIDPTTVFAITFPIFFGLMFGDVGHGLIVAVAGFVFSRSKGNEFIKDLGVILVFCGIAAMFFGFMYGTFFGIEEKVIKAYWVNPAEHPTTFLLYSVLIGIAQLSLGIIMEFGNCIAEREYKHMLHPLSKIMIFWSGAYTILNFGTNFGAWGTTPFAYTALAGFGVIILSGLTEIKGEKTPKKVVKGLMSNLFEVYEVPMNLLSNCISYARIFALVLVHAGLSLAMFQVASLVEPLLFGVLKIVVIIIGTIGIVVLEGMMVFLHTMRLHYYEWFSKFFSAEGRAFSPLQFKQDYTTIEN